MSKRQHKAAHKAKKTASHHEDTHEKELHASEASEAHDESHSESAEEADEVHDGAHDNSHEDSGHNVDDEFEKAKENEKIHLEFFGSDILRAQAPEVMKIADTIADDWVKDGDFDKIPLGNHVAEALVGKGLRKAKEVEKKLEEKGVFLMARMGADYLKSKIKR